MAEEKTTEDIIISLVTWLLLTFVIYPLLFMWLWNSWMPSIFPTAPELTWLSALNLRILADVLITRAP